MYLGVDVGYSSKARSTGICVINPGLKNPLRCVHVRTDETFSAMADLLGRSSPLAAALDGPLVPSSSVTTAFEVVNRYRHCERLLSGGVFQKRCKPGPTNSPRGFSLHKQATLTANHLLQLFPKIIIQESFPNAFMGVLLPDSVYVSSIRRGIKSDIFWGHCLNHSILFRKLLRFYFGPATNKILKAACLLTDHDEIAAFICALSARGAAFNANTLVGDRTGGAIALPPRRFMQPWASATLLARSAFICQTAV